MYVVPGITGTHWNMVWVSFAASTNLAEPDIATPVWSGVEDHATPGSGFQAASICAWAKSPFTTRFWAEAVRRKDRPRQTKARERALFEKIVKAMSPLFPLSE